MNDELQFETVEYNGFEKKDNGQVIFKSKQGFFSFFPRKKDETETKALSTFKEIAPEAGELVRVCYKLNGKYKNAVYFSRAKEGDVPSAIRQENPQDRNEVIMTLTAKVKELEQRLEGLEALVRAEKGDEAVELHQSFEKTPSIEEITELF